MTQPNPAAPTFNAEVTFDLFRAGKFDDVCEHFDKVLLFLHANTIYTLDDSGLHFINVFLKTFFYVLSQPGFVIPDHRVERFLQYNRVISNVTAMSSFKTTDAYIAILSKQQVNFVPLLILWSARNTIKPDRKAIFDMSPHLSSIWYLEYGSLFYSGLISETVVNNLREHFEFSHPGLVLVANIQEVYFGSTYVDGKCDRPIKTHLNAALTNTLKGLPPARNRPKKNKIAVFSGYWRAGHSVYRNYYHYLKTLRPTYHLTFYKLIPGADCDETLFDDVQSYDLQRNGVPGPASLQDNDYEMVIFPDVGMYTESILLANRRLAPIQICWPGHSVSTFGSQMDYFISGKDVELAENPERNYSERLVLVPGMGVIHNKPTYELTNKRMPADRIRINCPWYAQKVNHNMLQTMKKIVVGTEKKIVFRLFIEHSLSRQNDFLPFVTEIKKEMGDNLEVVNGLRYQLYMEQLEQGDLSIDSIHFGGCNTISDSLFLRTPTISWEGEKWYNRIGPQMLRLVGMQECIATSEEEYIKLVLRMINDDAYRADVRQRLEKVDLDSTIYSTADAPYFLHAVDYLIENHAKLQKKGERTAITIQR